MVRTAENYDFDLIGERLRPEPIQYFKPVQYRHLQIQEHDARNCVGRRRGLQELDRLCAVRKSMNNASHFGFLERSLEKKSVVVGILHQQ